MKFRNALVRFRQEIAIYRRAMKHPRTPKPARWLLGIALAYAISPLDLVPDFIPVIGHLDDLIIVSGLVWIALRLIPEDVLDECRASLATASGVNGS